MSLKWYEKFYCLSAFVIGSKGKDIQQFGGRKMYEIKSFSKHFSNRPGIGLNALRIFLDILVLLILEIVIAFFKSINWVGYRMCLFAKKMIGR